MGKVRVALPCLLLVCSMCSMSSSGEVEPRLRRPVALQLTDDGKTLFVANASSGSVSLIDLDKAVVAAEIQLGQKLSDLVGVRNKQLLATDEESHELLWLTTDKSRVDVRQRLPVAKYPVSVVASADGRRGCVASLWSRRLTFVDLPAGDQDEARVSGTLDLPFPPRVQLLVKDDTRLLVADAFGGRVGVVDFAAHELLSVRTIPGHNIRGMGVSASGEMLLISHQMLNELAHTVRNDVHWGLLMSNDLRWLKLDAVLDGESDLYKGAHMHPLGEAGRATGDPAGLAVAGNGTVVVALGGVGEIAIGREDDFSLDRTKVGRRPAAVAVTADGKQAFIANTFDDSISVVDLEKREQTRQISLGMSRELTLAERGELLFFDARLSHDAWMSCNSCHPGGHTNGMLNDNFSDGSFGAPKRVLSLLGRSGTEPFAWNGETKNYDEQIRKSIANTMQSDEAPRDEHVEALAAFLETLPPPPPIDLARGDRDEAAVARGAVQFAARRCDNCHAPPKYTTPKTYDVGLTDKLGNERFNPPPLIGVGQRGPYFHDGRAATLEDVFRQHQHKVPADLTGEDLRDLAAFLRSL